MNKLAVRIAIWLLSREYLVQKRYPGNSDEVMALQFALHASQYRAQELAAHVRTLNCQFAVAKARHG